MTLPQALRELGALLEEEIDALGAGDLAALDGFVARKRTLIAEMRRHPPPPADAGEALRREAERVRDLLRRDADLLGGLNAVLAEAVEELRRAGGHAEPPRLYGPSGRSVGGRETASSLDKSL